MRVLFFTPSLPLPPFSGGQVRSLNLIKQIAKKHEVTVFSFIRDERENQYVPELNKIVVATRTFRRRSLNSPLNLKNLFTFPFAAALYFDPNVARELKAEIEKGYDLVHFESFYTFPYLRKDLGVPTVAGNQNVEYFIYQRYAATKPEPARSLMRLDIKRMKKFEERVWRDATTTVAVSQPDGEVIKKVVGYEPELIANGIETGFFRDIKRRPEENLFLFVGPTKYIQNDDAAKYLVREIWPKIKEQIADAKLWFVGRQQQKWLLELNSEDIRVQTDLDDIREAYTKAFALIAPLRAGSGTKFKVLEAFACGVPVLTTSVGIEGIDATDNHSVLLAQSPEEFAQKAKLLLEDVSLSAKITQQAKKLVEDRYTWDKIGQRLLTLYEKTVHP